MVSELPKPESGAHGPHIGVAPAFLFGLALWAVLLGAILYRV